MERERIPVISTYVWNRNCNQDWSLGCVLFLCIYMEAKMAGTNHRC